MNNEPNKPESLTSVTCAELPHLPLTEHFEQAFDGGYWHFHIVHDDAEEPIPCAGRLSASFETVPHDPKIAKCARCGAEAPIGDFPVDFPGWPHLQLPARLQDEYGCSGAPPGKGICKYCRQDEADERHHINPLYFLGVDVIE